MQNARQPKWDWATHLPQMLELYYSGHTIPQIHKAIQCDGFRPSQRAVYNRFGLERLSTEHGRTPKPLPAGSPADPEDSRTPTCRQTFPVAGLEETVPEAEKCVLIEDNLQTAASNPLDTTNTSTLSQRFDPLREYGSKVPLPLPEEFGNESLTARVFLDQTRFAENNIVEDAKTGTLVDLRTPMSALHSSDRLPSEEREIGRSREHQKRQMLIASDHDTIIQNLVKYGLISDTQHSGGRTRHPYRPKEPVSSLNCRPKTPIAKIRSLFDSKQSASKARAKQNSPFPDNDSGYHSGRGTPSTLRSRYSLVLHPESLTEFQGLHRVACHVLHEPKHTGQYGEIPGCHFCGYSSVHNLAWSANHLKLQDFQTKLMSKNPYDPNALDAAGNSALHYAAVSGASYGHLEALSEAGVPLYQRNTANQNFLHCLRPRAAGTESYSLDCFKFGLIKVLELTEPKIAFGQQDNDGQTILHMLASHITEPELRERTFKMFRESGFPPIVLNRFGKSAKDVSPSTYKAGQTMFAADTFNTVGTLTPDFESQEMSEWQRRLLKQMNAYNTIVAAHHNPHFVDSTTRDTILHALSRVNVQSRGSMQNHDIIQDLRQFVAKGVNLNRHNRDGHHPLAALICNQDFRGIETGATMAKFIDILLWRGGEHGANNDINVNMMIRSGATALYEAAVHAQSDSVRSLIEARANVNARLNNDPRGPSILQATFAARDKAVLANDDVRIHIFKEVISHLEHAGAVAHPTSLQERGRPM